MINQTQRDYDPKYLKALNGSLTHHTDGANRTPENYLEFEMGVQACASCKYQGQKENYLDRTLCKNCFLYSGKNNTPCADEYYKVSKARRAGDYPAFHKAECALRDKIQAERDRVAAIQAGDGLYVGQRFWWDGHWGHSSDKRYDAEIVTLKTVVPNKDGVWVKCSNGYEWTVGLEHLSPLCPTCGGRLDKGEHGCESKKPLDHSHGKTAEPEPQGFKKGELVIGRYDNILHEVQTDNRKMNLICGDFHKQNDDCFKPIKPGAVFIAKCGTDIFASGQGKFIVLGYQPLKKGDISIDPTGFITTTVPTYIDMRWIVAPLDLEHYDTEVVKGVWIRVYENGGAIDDNLVYYRDDDGLDHRFRHSTLNLEFEDTIITALKPRIVPLAVSQYHGGMSAPERSE